MDQITLLWILGGICGINTFLLTWIKIDIKALWKRADCHGHRIKCKKEECEVETKEVLITAGGRP